MLYYSFSIPKLYNRYGNLYICVDDELKTELQNKLIAGILKFHTMY